MLEFPKPAPFHHAIVKMSSYDTFVENNNDWRPGRCDAEGRLFRDQKDAGHEQFMSHAEIYAKLQNGSAKIRYRANAPETQRLRAVFGDKTFDDIRGKPRSLALFREKLIKRFDEECLVLGKKPRWSKETFEKHLRTWRNEILTEMIGLESDKSVARADEMIELRAFPTPSLRTFRRDYKRYCETGGDIMGIVHRHHGPGKHFRKVDMDSLAFAHKEALNYMTATKPTKAKVYMDYRAALSKENSQRLEQGWAKLERITRYKFESMIDDFDEFDKWEGRNGRSSALKHFAMAKRGIDAVYVGERVEIDFWNVELTSLFVETGMWAILPPSYKAAIEGERVWFVAAIDVATRYILAFRASLNPSGAAAVAAIRMIMSDKRHISDFVGAETPWIGKVYPRDIFSDNGREFANDLVEGVLRAAKINFNRPQAGKPQARPFIESLFHTIGPMIAAYFEGRTFGSIAEKGDYDPEARMSLQVDELIRLFTFAVCDIYHNKPHGSLGGATPHNAWVRAVAEHSIEYPAEGAEEMLDIFGQKYKRRIGKRGITFMGVTYTNEELHRQRTKFGQMDFDIKVDPENIEQISVRGDGGWFAVKNIVGLDGSVSLDEWICARRELRQQHAVESEAGLEAMLRAINRLREIGQAAALRANLTPRHLTAEHYEILEAELFGAWEAVALAQVPALTQAFVIPEDPLREGKLSSSTAVQEFHAERQRDGRKSKKLASPDSALPEPAPVVETASYYEEY